MESKYPTHPTMKLQNFPKALFVNAYPPPVSVINDVSSADENAVKSETNPAIKKERITEGPASPAATPLRTNIPAPMMFVMPIDAAPKVPMSLFSEANYILLYMSSILYGVYLI